MEMNASRRPYRPRPARAAGRALLALALGLALAACDAHFDSLSTTGPGAARLPSGVYVYRAWSDFSARGPVWSGHLELRVRLDGSISGSYRLPAQCSDRWGRVADCHGRVHGQLYRDGSLVFDLDDGWLRNEGLVRRHYDATGYWDARLTGYRDSGRFELLLR
jgi:hypothetical protein